MSQAELGRLQLNIGAARALAGELAARPAVLHHHGLPWQRPGMPVPDFWNRTMQNLQSEFLAVASMAVLSIYLRQRGSPESKPVGASHHATGVEG